MNLIFEVLLVLALVLAIGLANLLRALFAQRIPAAIRFRPVESSPPPNPFADLFETTERELASLGFEHWFWCLAERTPESAVGPALLGIYRHHSEPVFARVHGPDDLIPADRLIVTFFSHRPDGELAGTINRIPEVFPRPPATFFQGLVTHVDTLAAQWQAHRAFVAGLGGTWSMPEAPESTCDILTDYEGRYLRWLKERGHVRPHPEGGMRISARVALDFIRRSLIGRVVAVPPEAVPIPARRAAFLFLRWRENARRAAPMDVQWGLFAFSALLFTAAGALFWSLGVALMLLAVILFHEGGHYLAMRLFGYRNLQVLMLPLVGGVAMGFEARPAAANRAFVSLMGPLPGIVLGWALLWVNLSLGGPVWLTLFAAILLALNYLNLLPVSPLDGGQILGALIPPERLLLRALFDGLAVLALAWVAWSLQSGVLLVLALVPLSGLLGARRGRRMREDLLQAWAEHPAASEIDRIQAAIEVFDRHSPQYRPLLKKAREIDGLIEATRIKPASRLTTGLLLTLYLAAFGAPLALVPMMVPTLAGWFQGHAPTRLDEAPFREEARAFDWPTLVRRIAELEGAQFHALTSDTPPETRRPGATTVGLADAEARLGLALPVDYQAFLRTSNGMGSVWNRGQDWLLPADAIGFAPDRAVPALALLRQTARELPEAREGLFVIDAASPSSAPARLPVDRLDALLVIGGLELDGGFIALDPSAASATGEFPLLYLHDAFEVTRYSGFRAFLEAEYARLRALLAGSGESG